MKNPLHLLYLYYNNPKAIFNLEANGVDQLQVPILIVDDGSPEPLRLNWPNVTVIRIEKDIPWNMSAANNLGLSHLPEDAVVMRMDIDHWIGEEMLAHLRDFSQDFPANTLLKFDRMVHKENGGYITPPPPNIYLTRAKDLIQAGGYDERFVGHYGYEDTELMWRLKKKEWTLAHIRDHFVQCHHNLGTPGLNRDTSRNKILLNEILGGLK